MRRSIRLTGRKQLPVSAFDFEIRDVNSSQLVTLGIPPEVRGQFPASARVRVKLVENKRVVICDFGTLGNPKADFDVGLLHFAAPSCQIRISESDEPRGLLLASTPQWTYRTGGAQDGILIFQAKSIAPQLWSLDIRAEEYPILYIDDRIPDPAGWAGSSSLFQALVFPSVLKAVFRHITISNEGNRPEEGWMADWVRLSDTLLGELPLPAPDDEAAVDEWCDRLIDTFLSHHQIDDHAVSALRSA